MNRKILIIEDDPLIRRELKILLESALYEAASLTGFENIPEQIQAENPDVI